MSETAAQSGFRSGLPAATGLLSDERLVRRAAEGNDRAFAAIFNRYHQALYRYCLAIVGNAEDAQDAMQNTMVKVLRALPGEERHIELKPWLYRIAHNESIELLRRRREAVPLDPEHAAASAGLAEEAAARERLRELISDLDELPERQRGALVMRELSGLGFAEIGAALGASQAVARQTLYEARLNLRRMSEGREMSCELVTKALSDGDRRVIRRRDLRAHLRTCASCRRFGEEIESRERDLAALSPLPAAAAAGLLQGLLGGPGPGGGGLATALGGGAAKTVGSSAALKGATTVAVVAAIGVGAADRGNMIDVGLPGDSDSGAIRVEQPADGGSAPGQQARAGSATTGPTAVSGSGAKVSGHLGASAVAKPGAGTVASNAASAGGETDARTAPAAVPESGPIAHGHGKGHEKQLPGAAAHGQQTAASHKAAGNGSTEGREHPEHPEHPVHPEHPDKPPHPARSSNSGAEKGSATPPAGVAVPEGKHPTAPTEAEEASKEHGNGKKP